MSAYNSQSTTMDKLLTPTELAELLGVSVHTLYHRRAQGISLPPTLKMGRLLRFPQSGVRHWLAAQISSSSANPNPPARTSTARSVNGK